MEEIITEHIWAGRTEAETDEWRTLYHQPQFTNATCKRCGCAVNDLTQHEVWHARFPE